MSIHLIRSSDIIGSLYSSPQTSTLRTSIHHLHNPMIELTAAAVCIERHHTALVLFETIHLRETVVRQLPSDPDKAIESLQTFLNQIKDHHFLEIVAFCIPPRASSRLHILYGLLQSDLRAAGIPFVPIDEIEMLETYAHPPLKRREQLRKIARSIWPSLDGPKKSRAVLDAALVGLHLQTDRLFTLHQPSA